MRGIVMMWKLLIVAAVIAIIVGGIVWVGDGMEIYTKTREKVVTEVKDELFGTTQQVVKWEPTFKYGLLPDDADVSVVHRGYVFVLGVSGMTILLSVFMLRRRSVP